MPFRVDHMNDMVIVDYGMGNLHSVRKAFEVCGCRAALSRDPGEVEKAGALVVPGVGSFGDCAANLDRFGLREAIARFIESGKPYLGICLGLQILLTSSEESPGVMGFGVVAGAVRRFPKGLKVPHMGWNTLSIGTGGRCPLFERVDDGAYVYFVHSYYAEPDDPDVVSAVTEYGGRFASALRLGNVMATQFHPEKSQRVGLMIIENFIRYAKSAGG